MRLHLAQIHYSAAYYDSPVDYLEEPTDGQLLSPRLGEMRAFAEVSGLLLELKGLTTSHLSAKLTGIARWSADRNANILVFPEYAVPVQALPKLREIAANDGLTIVAGSHRVSAGDESRSLYESLGLTATVEIGTAISPILLPNGTVCITTKTTPSKWESGLKLPIRAQLAT